MEIFDRYGHKSKINIFEHNYSNHTFKTACISYITVSTTALGIFMYSSHFRNREFETVSINVKASFCSQPADATVRNCINNSFIKVSEFYVRKDFTPFTAEVLLGTCANYEMEMEAILIFHFFDLGKVP
ncbi:hypothetical protein TNCT_165491 [Trichonephila clavata]|uniref:Uncharacterized protein n=1 Tax=Trichonephila clavata TaxID=2740835 RepID=A0A8X6JAM1_TRICU|nr:hypothetical protein TNCT_165491 [Trichonephila clavata]